MNLVASHNNEEQRRKQTQKKQKKAKAKQKKRTIIERKKKSHTLPLPTYNIPSASTQPPHSEPTQDPSHQIKSTQTQTRTSIQHPQTNQLTKNEKKNSITVEPLFS